MTLVDARVVRLVATWCLWILVYRISDTSVLQCYAKNGCLCMNELQLFVSSRQ